MNKWTKKNAVKTIKERANFNARLLVRYVNSTLNSTNEDDRKHFKDMANIYCYQLRENINMYEDFGIIGWEKSTDLKEKVWDYYSKVFK